MNEPLGVLQSFVSLQSEISKKEVQKVESSVIHTVRFFWIATVFFIVEDNLYIS